MIYIFQEPHFLVAPAPDFFKRLRLQKGSTLASSCGSGSKALVYSVAFLYLCFMQNEPTSGNFHLN